MNSPVIAGSRTAKEMKERGVSLVGYNDAVMRQYFNIDWQYTIDQSEAIRDYTTKNAAFQAWKRGFKGK